MKKRKGPRPGSTLHWLSKRLDWPSDKLLATTRLQGKSVKYIHRARHQLRAKYGLGELAQASKSHPQSDAPKQRKQRKQKKPKQKKQPQQQLTALQLKISRVRKLIFEIGWDAARELFHEFEDTYSRWE